MATPSSSSAEARTRNYQLNAFHERFPDVGHDLIPPQETLALEQMGSILLLLRKCWVIVGSRECSLTVRRVSR
jgi:hypothetical protein